MHMEKNMKNIKLKNKTRHSKNILHMEMHNEDVHVHAYEYALIKAYYRVEKRERDLCSIVSR